MCEGLVFDAAAFVIRPGGRERCKLARGEVASLARRQKLDICQTKSSRALYILHVTDVASNAEAEARRRAIEKEREEV